MQLSTSVWTQTLVNGTLVITDAYELSSLSILLVDGTGSVSGALYRSVMPPAPLDLPLNVGVTVTSGGALLNNITITTTGTILLIGK